MKVQQKPSVERVRPSEAELSELPQDNYDCTECSQKFRKKVNLFFHLEKTHGITRDNRALPFSLNRNHETVYIYHCPVVTCRHNQVEHGFRKYNKLKQHFEIVHMPKRYQCQQCEANFQTPFLLKNHQLNCGIRHMCPICGKSYSLRKFLAQHFRRSHPGSSMDKSQAAYFISAHDRPLDLSCQQHQTPPVPTHKCTSTHYPSISRAVECSADVFVINGEANKNNSTNNSEPYPQRPWSPQVDSHTQTRSFLRHMSCNRHQPKETVDYASCTEPNFLGIKFHSVNTSTAEDIESLFHINHDGETHNSSNHPNGSDFWNNPPRTNETSSGPDLLDLTVPDRRGTPDIPSRLDTPVLDEGYPSVNGTIFRGASCQTIYHGPLQTRPQSVQVQLFPNIEEIAKKTMSSNHVAAVGVETADFDPFDWSLFDTCTDPACNCTWGKTGPPEINSMETQTTESELLAWLNSTETQTTAASDDNSFGCDRNYNNIFADNARSSDSSMIQLNHELPAKRVKHSLNQNYCK